MAVRNCAELGENLQKIVSRLMANDNLVNLLYYSDKDPLSKQSLTQEEKRKEIYEKLIKVVPRIGPKENAQSLLSIRVVGGATMAENNEFKTVIISIETIVPLTQWVVKSDNLRPFLIMGEVQKSLDNKTINGLGKMVGGDFELNFLTEEVSCYTQTFEIVAYD